MGTKRGLRTTMSVLLCVVLAGGWSSTWARTIYVDDDAAEGQDGSSWAAAFQYLQDALAVAKAGDEIRVAQGVYRPARLAPGESPSSAEYEASFRLVDGTTVLGGFAGRSGADPNQREPALFTTILTGDLAGDDDPNGPLFMSNGNSRTVVLAWKGRSTLDGVTVTRGITRDGGSGAGLSCAEGDFLVRNCTFLKNWSDGAGAGICNSHGAVRVENCRFLRNQASRGAGLSNSYGTAEVIDCEFIDSYAPGGSGIYTRGGKLRIEHSRFLRNRGPALCNRDGPVEVIASEFVENRSDDNTPGVLNDNGQAVFFGCLFRANRSPGVEGVVVLQLGEMSLLYCTFIDNYGPEVEGAVTCIGGRTRIANCLFSGNRGVLGALEVWYATVSLQQCTFYGNTASEAGCAGAVCDPTFRPNASAVTARGCIFWGNRNLHNDVTGYDAQISGDPNFMAVEYSCIEGWTPQRGGLGNIGADPLFVAPDQNDFHLKSQAGHWDAASLAWVLDDVTSPCIDAGDPNSSVGQEPCPNGGRVNLGVYGGTCEASKSWFGVEPGPGVEAADLNGDGRVDVEDYRLALQRWPQMDE